MKFNLIYCFTLLLLVISLAQGKLLRRGFQDQEELVSYIIVLKDDLSTQQFEDKISALSSLIGEENVTQVYRMTGFRGLAANVPNSIIQKIEADESVDYVEKDSTVSVNGAKRKNDLK